MNEPNLEQSPLQENSAELEAPNLGETDPGEPAPIASELDAPVIFAQVESEVYATAISPDGRRVVAGLKNGSLQLFDLISGSSIGQPFRGHEGLVWSVAFAPDGQTIVSGSEDKTIRLWSLNGTPISQPFQGHEGRVLSVAFAPDGQTIVSGSEDGTIRLWSLNGTSISQPFQGHEVYVWSVAFAPDGQTIVSGSEDGTIRLWSLNGTPIGQPLRGHEGRVWSVAFAPDGQIIVSGSEDGTIRLWNLNGTSISQPFQGHEDRVLSVAFAPDGQTIVSGSDDKTIRLWSLQGTPISQPLRGHEGRVLSVAFAPDGQTIVSGSDDKTIRLWSLQGTSIGQPFQGHEGRVLSVAFAPDGQTIVSGSADKTIRLWSLNGTPIGQPLRGHEGRVLSVAFAPDGQTIVSGGEDGTIRLWSLNGTPISQPLRGHEVYVWSVAFAPDGQTIVSGSEDGTIRLWSLNGTPIGQPLRGHEGPVWSVAFAPDGQIIVSGSADKTIRLWNLNGTPIGQPFQGHKGPVWSVAFAPDGQTIVSGSEDGTIRLWSLNGTSISQPFQGHEGLVLSVAFAPDGQTIVSGGEDGTIRLWSLNGTPISQPLRGHEGPVLSVAFAPDGQTTISSSADKTIRLWASPHAIFGKPIRNLADRSRQISIPQSVANDLAQGEDQLNVKDEIEALATVLMLRSLRPPVAVGILGSWGSGKSFGMYLIRQRVNEIRRQKLTLSEAWGDPETPTRTEITSPYVGHIYQIEFNAWTYAKSDLWASLMQEIFYELNRQISLERQLGHILSESRSSSTKAAPAPDLPNTPPKRLVDQFIYTPLTETKNYFSKFIKQIREQIITLIQRILNLWIVQIISHIIIPFILIGFIIIGLLALPLSKILGLLAKLLDRLTSKKPTFFSKSSKIFGAMRDWFTQQTAIKFLASVFETFGDWLGQQATNYYFPNGLEPSYGFLPRNVELVLEYILFFLFLSFPKRLSDRRQYWQQISKQSASDPTTPQDSAVRSEPNSDSRAFSQALREGGDFWQVLYLMNEEERTAFLKVNLKPDQFNNWKTLTSSAEISNSLWKALDKIKQEEQELFKQNEKTLQDKEKELQRRLKSAEAGVNQQVSQRTLTALWAPLVNAVARLRFPSDKIEAFAAAGKTGKMLRQTITSWQGLLALFFMTFITVLALDAKARTAIIITLADLLEQPGVTNLFHRLIPAGVTNYFISLNKAILTWFNNLPQWTQAIQAQIPAGVQVFTAITAAVTALIPVLKTLGTYITSVQKEQARIQSERDTLLKQEQSKAEGLVKEVAQLKLQVAEQRQRAGLTANYASLIDFVNARLSGDDYGKHLGLMQQVKQDLAALSDRLTDSSHNRAELEKCFPRGPARVILYIDDLDRCPPNRVVEVLEAVQLLLNTKLFIVVLGIDDRYIARALEQVYQGVLKRGGKPSGIDYLEKIIQIPYRMRPISPATVDNYLRSQLKLRPSAPATVAQQAQQASAQLKGLPPQALSPQALDADSNGQGKNQESTTPTIAQTDPSASPASSAPPLSPDQTVQQIAEPLSLDSRSEDSEVQQSEREPDESIPVERSPDSTEFSKVVTAQTKATPTPTPTPAVDSATYLETIAEITEFDETEFKLLVDCCRHVDITPRTAKRLINIYKILQIIWSTRSQKTPPKSPPTDQDKRVVMSFLALSGRYPSLMRNLFEEIDFQLEENASDEAYKLNFEELLKAIHPQSAKDDFHAQREWRRFKGDIKRMLIDPQLTNGQITELSIDRPTFDLMLSFCFVGDIGYDPDDYQSNPQLNSASKNQESLLL